MLSINDVEIAEVKNAIIVQVGGVAEFMIQQVHDEINLCRFSLEELDSTDDKFIQKYDQLKIRISALKELADYFTGIRKHYVAMQQEHQ